jgi:hypothetical protein
VHQSPNDEYFSIWYSQWQFYLPTFASYFHGNCASMSYTFAEKNTAKAISHDGSPYHDIDTTQAAWVEAHLLANM